MERKWELLTEDNEDLVYKFIDDGFPVVIALKMDDYMQYGMHNDFSPSIHTMTKLGNYFFMVLPKLTV